MPRCSATQFAHTHIRTHAQRTTRVPLASLLIEPSDTLDRCSQSKVSKPASHVAIDRPLLAVYPRSSASPLLAVSDPKFVSQRAEWQSTDRCLYTAARGLAAFSCPPPLLLVWPWCLAARPYQRGEGGGGDRHHTKYDGLKTTLRVSWVGLWVVFRDVRMSLTGLTNVSEDYGLKTTFWVSWVGSRMALIGRGV